MNHPQPGERPLYLVRAVGGGGGGALTADPICRTSILRNGNVTFSVVYFPPCHMSNLTLCENRPLRNLQSWKESH